MAGRRIYGVTAVENFLDKIAGYGCYELHQIDEGSLGCGTWICEPLEDHYKWVIIKEVALNEWSSGHTVSFRKQLTKADAKMLDDYKQTLVTWTVHTRKGA